jgi:hypothetical protein
VSFSNNSNTFIEAPTIAGAKELKINTVLNASQDFDNFFFAVV